jgi:hypothetical protein
MPKFDPRKAGLLALAAIAAVIVAAILSGITQGALGLPNGAVRYGALNIASLVVAFMLVAGIGRRQKDKR